MDEISLFQEIPASLTILNSDIRHCYHGIFKTAEIKKRILVFPYFTGHRGTIILPFP